MVNEGRKSIGDVSSTDVMLKYGGMDQYETIYSEFGDNKLERTIVAFFVNHTSPFIKFLATQIHLFIKSSVGFLRSPR